ncbi:MAG TPA: hypothetical protein PK559_01125, partial [Ignavibacteriaceae bacterium]|nr:hypothetical protein [Ignavibacteriaceae bacterium]
LFGTIFLSLSRMASCVEIILNYSLIFIQFVDLFFSIKSFPLENGNNDYFPGQSYYFFPTGFI